MAGTEEYGLQLNITTNANEVQKSLENIKKLLDEMTKANYKINIDTASLKTMQDAFKNMNQTIGTTLKAQVSETSGSIDKMTQSINKSIAVLNKNNGKKAFTEEISELKTLKSTLEDYANKSKQLSEEELANIKNRVKSISELSQAVEKSSTKQASGTNQVTNAYVKLAQALNQINSIQSKANNYAIKNESEAVAVQNSISSLQSYKLQIEQLMSSQSQLGNLTQEQYMKIVAGINNAKSSLSAFMSESSKINSLVSQYDKQKASLDKLKETHKKLATQVAQGTKEQQTSYKNLSKEISNIEKSLSNATSQKSFDKISQSIKNASSSAKQLKAELNSTTTATSRLNDMLSRASSYLTGRMMYEASAMLTRGVRDLVSSTLEMNEAMTEMAMVTGTSISKIREDFRGYNDVAKELKVSTNDISKAMIEFARQGLDAETAMNRVKVTTKFAKAAAVDFTESAQLLTAGFNSMGEGIEDNFLLLSDVLLELGRKAGTSAEEVAVAMQKSASLASQNGVNLSELAAMISTVSEKTRTSAETIGTSFASMMSRFGNMTLKGFDEDGNSINYVSEALEKVNIQIKDNKGWKSYSQILSEVGEVWKDLKADVEKGGDAAKKAQDTMNLLATQLAGTRQKNTFVGLMDEFDRYIELIDVANNAVGTTNESYAVYLDSTEASINSFKANWEAVKLSFSDTGFLDGILGAASTLMGAFAEAPGKGLAFVAVIATMTKTVSSLGLAWKKAVAEAIVYNMQTAGMSAGQAILTALGVKVSAVGTAYNAATVSATAFSAAATLGIGLAITLLTTMAIKMLDTEKKARKLNETFRDLKTASSNYDKVQELEKAVELYNDIKTTKEEQLELESQINLLKSEVGEIDAEYKNILENENLALETQLALIKEIAREEAERKALEAKKLFEDSHLKSAEFDETKSMWDSDWQQLTYLDELIAKTEEFYAKKNEALELEKQIKAVESSKNLYSEEEKIKKIKELNEKLQATKNSARETGSEILKMDSQINSINADLPIEEQLAGLNDLARDNIEGYFNEFSDGADNATGSVEELKDTIDETTKSAKDLANEISGESNKIDFLNKMIEEYKEYGKISYDTAAELVGKYEEFIPLLKDENTFIKNATAERKELEKSTTDMINNIINSYDETKNSQTDVADNSKKTTDAMSDDMSKYGESVDNVGNKIRTSILYALDEVERKSSNVATQIERTFSNIKIKIPVTTTSGSILSGNKTDISTSQPRLRTIDMTEEANNKARGNVQAGVLDKPSSGSGSSGSSGNKKPSSSSSSSSSKNSTVKNLELVIDKFQVLNQKIDNVNNALEKYEILGENANSKEKLRYLQKEIELYEQKKKLLIELYNTQQKELASMKKKLQNQGFIIDNQGVITNYEKQLQSLQDKANKLSGTAKENAIEKVEQLEDLIKEFVSLNNEIQGTDNSIAEMNNTIYDAMKEQIEIISEAENKILEILKKQLDEKLELIEKEKSAKIDAINAERELYNKQIEEDRYEENLKSEKDKLLDIQSQIDKLSKDSSLNGKKKLEELKQQLADQQKVIDDMVKQNEIDKNNALFDAEIDRLEEEAEAAKEKLEEEFREEKMYLIAQQALKDGVFKDVNGKIVSVKDAFLEFEDKFNSGLSVMGKVLKQELINNLQTAMGLIGNMSGILDKMGITNLISSSNIFGNNARMSVSTPNMGGAMVIDFNAPLINVEGNVDRNAVNDLENLANNLKETIYDELANELRMRGV